MSSRLQKHSLTLQGHRTSVTLEDEFWQAFGSLARARGVSVNQMAAEIDAARREGEGLASAIRVFCLNQYRDRVPARLSARPTEETAPDGA